MERLSRSAGPARTGDGRSVVWMWPQLEGCTRGYIFPTRTRVRAVILVLSGCRKHRGGHHFAVVRDGYGVAMSEAGEDCVRRAGLLS